MKKIFTAIVAAAIPLLAAADNTGSLHISKMSVNKGEDLITVNMTVDPARYSIGGSRIVTLTPMLAGPADTVALTPMRIAGRRAWYSEIRDGRETPLTLSRAGKSAPVDYSATIPFSPAFETSEVIIKADTADVCNCRPPQSGLTPVARLDYRPRTLDVDYHYVAPLDSAEKTYDLSGRANVIFKVNRTEIDWSYARNHAELDTILRTINVVRDNPDATVKAIYLTGYASPEGPYNNNVRLARGRTEAVKDYVANHSTFPASIYHTASVPEDWAGLREWVAASSMPAKDAMLAFIDNPTIPADKRNDIFMKQFPEQYPFLLANVYPSLRHTDYRITYTIRKFYDVNDIRRVFAQNPRYLSLNELFLLANSLQPGSPEYDEVFEVAARLYPDNPTANLNAANSAMNRGNYESALRHLDRAGSGPEVQYARGVLLLKTGDYDAAEKCLKEALEAGIPGAQAALDQIKLIRDFKGNVEIL